MNIKIKIGTDGEKSWENSYYAQRVEEAEKAEDKERKTENEDFRITHDTLKENLLKYKKQQVILERNNDSQKQSQGLSAIYQELENLIGLDNVKKLILEVQAFTEMQKLRQAQQLNAEATVLHSVFKGNPGTGKTTVARIMAKLLKEMGVLEKGHLVEIERADLVGEYIGHTAQKTREQVKKAMGGVLFIDEAYALARGDQKDFGKEAIEVILKAMEDQRNNLVVILAGYPKEIDYFLESNPGLKSRFPLHIDFPDYTLPELVDIADQMYAARDYRMNPAAKEAMKLALADFMTKGAQNYGNARLVRNMAEASIRSQAVRLLERKDWQFNKSNLMEIAAADIEEATKKLSHLQTESTANSNEGQEEKQPTPNDMLNQLNSLPNIAVLLHYLQQLSYPGETAAKQRFEVI